MDAQGACRLDLHNVPNLSSLGNTCGKRERNENGKSLRKQNIHSNLMNEEVNYEKELEKMNSEKA